MKLVVISQSREFTTVKYQGIIWLLYRHLTEGMCQTRPAKKTSNR